MIRPTQRFIFRNTLLVVRDAQTFHNRKMSSDNEQKPENNGENIEGVEGSLTTTESELDEVQEPVQEPEIKVKTVERVEAALHNGTNNESEVQKVSENQEEEAKLAFHRHLSGHTQTSPIVGGIPMVWDL